MSTRHRSNTQRQAFDLKGLGQDFGSEYTWDYGFAADVPAPPVVQSQSFWSQYLEPIVQTAKELVPVVYAAQQQQDLNEINLERARRGQPPLSSAYMAATAPRVNVGVAADTQRMLMWAGIGLVVILGLGTLMRRR